MHSLEIKKKFIEFYKSKEHKVIPNKPLIPENDPTSLFIMSGVQTLIPYVMGQKHPLGKRLVNIQRCLRTDDLEEVGDFHHNTFFEMLGVWSLDDYFKEESIKWTFEFLIEHLGFDPQRLYVSVYEGSEDIPKDEESIKIWKEVYKNYDIEASEFDGDEDKQKDFRIFPLGEANLWKTGEYGPQGPSTEVHYYIGEGKPDISKQRPGYNEENFIEIWNDVFMEYNKSEEKTSKLKQQNVDTGVGFDRLCAILQNMNEDGSVEKNVSNFETDLYDTASAYLRSLIEDETRKSTLNENNRKIKEFDYTLTDISNLDQAVKAFRIILDHMRAVTFLIGDGIRPSNKDQGYILRRLLRRAVRFARLLNIEQNIAKDMTKIYIEKYKVQYPHLEENKEDIINIAEKEEVKFEKTIQRGKKELDKLEGKGKKITGKDLFFLYETYGYPIEMALDELGVDKETQRNKYKDEFQQEKKKHQKESRQGAKAKFSGGLADKSKKSVRYHTATHLLLKALQIVLGDHVHQRGSNITDERLRFDFSHGEKLTDEEVKKVEKIVNEQIEKELEVKKEIMPKEKALEIGAECEFPEKYPGKVTVYSIEDFSSELCGGPHVENTGELAKSGKFKIVDQENIGSGVRRIKAVLK